MIADLKKFEEKRKSSLFETIGNTFRVGLEDLVHTMGFGKPAKHSTSEKSKNQISLDLDKYENMKIEKSKKIS